MRGSKQNLAIFKSNKLVRRAVLYTSIIFNLITVIWFIIKNKWSYTKYIVTSIPEVICIIVLFKISNPIIKYDKSIELIATGTNLMDQGIPSLLFDILCLAMIVKFLVFFNYIWTILYLIIGFRCYYEVRKTYKQIKDQ